jgi:hypothetical protein
MVAEHDPRPGVLEDVGDLVRREAGVDRHQQTFRPRSTSAPDSSAAIADM